MNPAFVTNFSPTTRFHHFCRGILSGYAIVVANIIYTGATIPFALYFLGKERFALWAVAQQVAGYLVLFELGVSSASSRLISNFKDNPNSPGYRDIFWSSAVLFLALGFFIALAGLGLAFFVPSLFELPAQVRLEFRNVMLLLSLTTALTISLRAFSTPLWAFQRMDVLNAGSIIFLLLSLFSLPFLFMSGWGLLSLPLSFFPGILLACLLNVRVCRQNRYYPPFPRNFQIPPSLLGQNLSFGSSVLLLNLGTQLVNSAPLLCAARILTLADVAILAIGLKMLNLFQNLFQKIMQNAAPGLTEIFVRGDFKLFIKRFRHVLLLSTFLGSSGGLFINCANSEVIRLWTGGKILFPASANFFLGALLALSSVTFCLFEFYAIKGQLKPIRFFRFFEGGFSLFFCLCGGFWFGLDGVLAGALSGAALGLLRIIRQLKKESFQSLIPKRRLAIGFFMLFLGMFSINVFFQNQISFWAICLNFFICFLVILKILIAPELLQEIRFRLWPSRSSEGS